MEIGGSISEREQWPQIAIPESGTYVIPDALVPVEVDHHNDRGVHVEPNIWVSYTIALAKGGAAAYPDGELARNVCLR